MSCKLPTQICKHTHFIYRTYYAFMPGCLVRSLSSTFPICVFKNTRGFYCFVHVLTRRTSADRKAAVVRATATGLCCVRVTQAVSQSLCGLGVWSAADGQGGEGQIPLLCVCMCVCLHVCVYPESGPRGLTRKLCLLPLNSSWSKS